MAEFTAVASALALLQSEKHFKEQQAAAEAQQASEASQAYQRQAIEDRRRREDLRKQQATQRARFGAQGVVGGSTQAVLDGQRARSEREIAEDRSVLDARFAGQNKLSRSRNALEEKQRRQKAALSLFLED